MTTIDQGDGFRVYCKAFRTLFGEDAKLELSPAALQEMLQALRPEGGASLDEKRWATLVFLHPMDVATVVMGAKTGTEMQVGMERLADAFLTKALKGA